ncbi:uncharacterized protein CBL_08272 [Carabus blaptoides fortunei]
MNPVRFCLLISAIILLTSAKLPSYIKPCKKNDPNLNECFMKNANMALPEVFKGDPTLGVRQYKPYPLPQMDLAAGDDLSFHVTSGIIYMPFKIEISRANVDFKEKSIDFTMSARQMTWLLDYVATGSIKAKAVNETGQAYILLGDVDCAVTSTFDTKVIDGKPHIEIQSAEMITSSKMFELLRYNTKQSEPKLNDEENEIFTATSKKIVLSIREKMKEMGSIEFRDAMNLYFKLAPENEIFP